MVTNYESHVNAHIDPDHYPVAMGLQIKPKKGFCIQQKKETI